MVHNTHMSDVNPRVVVSPSNFEQEILFTTPCLAIQLPTFFSVISSVYYFILLFLFSGIISLGETILNFFAFINDKFFTNK